MLKSKSILETHPRQDEIKAALAGGESLRCVAERYGVSKDALFRWKRDSNRDNIGALDVPPQPTLPEMVNINIERQTSMTLEQVTTQRTELETKLQTIVKKIPTATVGESAGLRSVRDDLLIMIDDLKAAQRQLESEDLANEIESLQMRYETEQARMEEALRNLQATTEAHKQAEEGLRRSNLACLSQRDLVHQTLSKLHKAKARLAGMM